MSRPGASGDRRARLDQSRPVRAEGILRFSDGAQVNLYDAVYLITQLRSRRWLFQELADACHVDLGWGRPRRQVYWCLLYMAYLMSGKAALKTWWLETASDPRIWWACEHRRPKTKRERRKWRPPCYETCRVRFIELEQFEDAFEECAAKLIRLVRDRHPELFRDIFVDGTESDGHVAVHHDCEDGDCCPDPKMRRLRRMPVKEARTLRHEETAIDEDAAADPAAASGEQPEGDGASDDDAAAEDEEDASERASERRAERAMRKEPIVRRYPKNGGVRFRAGEHWWWIRDPQAGLRVYQRKDGRIRRGWVGTYLYLASAMGMDVPIAAFVFNAAESETQNYERLMERVERVLEDLPRSVVGDRALYTRSVTRWNAIRGITTVAPHRRLPGMKESDPYPAGPGWDSDGSPNCRHCGGATQHQSGTTAKGRPRLFFECLQPQKPGCRRKQTISLLKDTRRLQFIRRTHDTYRALSHASHAHEHHNLHERIRHNLAPISVKDRIKRLGIAVQQLRASASLLVQWLRVCVRFGFLTGRHEPLEITPIPTPEEAREQARRRARQKEREAGDRRGSPPR